MAMQVFWETLPSQIAESIYNQKPSRGQCESFGYVDNFTLMYKLSDCLVKINFLLRSHKHGTKGTDVAVKSYVQLEMFPLSPEVC